MDPAALVAALGGMLPLLLLAGVVSIVSAVVAGLALQRGQPNPFLVIGPVGIPLVVAAFASAREIWRLDADPTHAVAVAAGLHLVAWFFALPAAGIVAVFAAVTGGPGTVRGWNRATALLAMAWVTTALTIAGGISQQDWLYPGLRGVLYAVLGALMAVSGLASDPENPRAPLRPIALAAMGGVFALIVAGGEMSARALETVFLLAVLPTVIPDGRTAYVLQALSDVILPGAAWHLMVEYWGTGTGLLAVGLALRGKASGLWWALVWVSVAIVLGDIGAVDLPALLAVAAAPAAAVTTPGP